MVEPLPRGGTMTPPVAHYARRGSTCQANSRAKFALSENEMGDRLAGKVTIVTGAGSGIGRATAIRFAEEGARVTCVDIDREAVESVAREIGDAAVAVAADVSDPAAVQAYTDDTARRWGGIHV